MSAAAHDIGITKQKIYMWKYETVVFRFSTSDAIFHGYKCVLNDSFFT